MGLGSEGDDIPDNTGQTPRDNRMDLSTHNHGQRKERRVTRVPAGGSVVFRRQSQSQARRSLS